MASIVTRDGKPVSPVLADENAAYTWLLKHQPMSTDWAIMHEGYAVGDARLVEYTWQFCQGDSDITASFHAPLDADTVRAWDEDFCLVEVAAVDDHWEVSGGDGDWAPLAERRFDSYGEALAAYGALHGLELREKS